MFDLIISDAISYLGMWVCFVFKSARNLRQKRKDFGSSSKMVLMAHPASTSAVTRSLTVSIESYNRNHFQMRIQPNAARRDYTSSPNEKRRKRRKRKPDRHRLMASTPSSSSPSSSKEVPESDNVLILYTKPGCCLCEGLEKKLKEVLELAQREANTAGRTTITEDFDNSKKCRISPDLCDYALEIRDVSLNKEWAYAHAGEIPVLFIGKRSDADDAQNKVKRPTPRVSVERLKLDLEKHLVSLATKGIGEEKTSTKGGEGDNTEYGGGWKIISAKPF